MKNYSATYILAMLFLLFTGNLFSQNNSQFISQTVPTSVNAGETFNVSITMKNTGTTTWSPSNSYNFGSQNLPDNSTWGTNRIILANDVAPGESITITASLTAPSFGGSYNFQWKMVEDGVEWFGQLTENVVIDVIPNYILVGTTVATTESCYDITPGTANGEVGAIWYKEKIDLNNPFDINFTILLKKTAGFGADGVMFVLQNVSNDTIGYGGGALGYNGLGTESMGIEFDIYNNRTSCGLGNWNDNPPYEYWEGPEPSDCSDHVAISKNGNVLCEIAAPVSMLVSGGKVDEDGLTHQARIKWDPATDSIHVYIDCELRINTKYNIIDDIFNGESLVYMGFTGSTGGAGDWAKQEVCLDGNLFSALEDRVICKGNSVEIDINGGTYGTPTWTPNYNIDDIHSTKPTVDPEVDTTYYLTYQHPECLDYRTDSVRVLVNNPTATISGDNVVCDDGTTSAITIDFDQDGDWAYTWNLDGMALTPGSSSNSQVVNNMLDGGTYSLTSATDSLGCNANLSGTATITVNDLPTPNISGNLGFCAGLSTTIDAGTYSSYIWNTGATSQTISVSTIGEYIVTVTDGNSCENTDTVQIVKYDLPIVDAGSDDDICLGNSIILDGSSSTGTGALTYAWSNSANTVTTTVTPSATATYTLIVTDINSCVNSNDIEITVNDLPIADAGVDDAICIGDATMLDAGNSTGAGTLNFDWSNGANTVTTSVSPISTFTYTVTVTDANNCESSNDIEIVVNSLPNPSAGTDQQICKGDTATLNASGSVGNGTLTYSWSNSTNTAITDVFPTSTTDFIVTVTDGNTCENTDTVEVLIYELPVVEAGTNSEICNGDTILLDASLSTGSGTLSFNWSNLATTNTTNAWPTTDSTYYVTVMDQHFCRNLDSIKITVNQLPSFASMLIVDVTNCITHNGEITINATNGHAPYQYNIDGSAFTTNNNWDTLNSTVYTYGILDDKGCEYYTDTVIPNSSGLAIDSVKFDEILCYGDTNSAITIYAQGTSIDYSIDDGVIVNSSNIFTNNGAGNYQLYIIDNSTSCEAGMALAIPQPTQLENFFTKYDIACYGDSTGSAVANYSEGTAGYTVNWTIGTSNYSTDSVYGLAANTAYPIEITDSKTCILRDTVTLTEPTELVISQIDAIDLLCNNDYTGSLAIGAIGGSPNYTYQWSETSVTDTIIENLSAGTYHYTITDYHLCNIIDSVEITQPDTLLLSSFTQNTICDTSNGIAVVNVMGGTTDYSYSWLHTALDNDTVENLQAATYFVTVTDNHNCQDSLQLVINDQSTGSITINQIQNVDCFSDSTANITASINGGTANYTFAWYNNSNLISTNTSATNTNNLQDIPEGYYLLEITDSMNCIISYDSIYVSQESKLESSFSISKVLCYNNEDGSISISTNGGVSPYTYNWSNGYSDSTISNMGEGTYYVTVTDSKNCETTIDSMVLENPARLILNITNVSDLTCFESDNGELDFEVTGGTPDYIYFVDSVEIYNTNFNNLAAGGYYLFALDSNYCIAADSFFVSQPYAISVVDSINYDNHYGNLFTLASGGTPDYYYTWENGETSPNNVNLAAGEYVLTVTDANNCEYIDTFLVETPLYIPSVITPNADDFNDTWEIPGINAYNSVKINIFNRWGDVIYDFDGTGTEYYDETVQWDGMWNGKELPLGTYVYILVIDDGKEKYTGTVTIVR